MSSKYFQAQDYDYWFKSNPRELSTYDSLAFAENFGHMVEGQGGIVLRTLANEVRKLHKEIHARKVSDAAISTSQRGSATRNNSADLQRAAGRYQTIGSDYSGTS